MTDKKPITGLNMDGMLARLGGQRALVRQLIDIFMEDAPDLIAEIEQGFSQRDGEAIRKSAHSLKGLLANFGDVESGLEIAQVELFATDNNFEMAAQHFERFKPAYKDLLAAIAAEPLLKTK